MKKILPVLFVLSFVGCSDLYVDNLLGNRFADHKLFYHEDFSTISSVESIGGFITNLNNYRYDQTNGRKEHFDNPEVTFNEGGICGDFALLFMNIAYLEFAVKPSVAVVDNDMLLSITPTRSIVSGGLNTSHAVVVVDGGVYESLNGRYYGTFKELEECILYMYTFDECFTY